MAKRKADAETKVAIETQRPSEVLKKVARKEAVALGHRLSHFWENANGTWTMRCLDCLLVASVIPAQYPKDKLGRGGRMLQVKCAGPQG